MSQADLTTSGGDGSIILTTLDGSITLTDGDTNNVAVSADGSGNILLAAGVNGAGTATSGIALQANAAVQTVTGNIVLTASRGDVVQAAGANLVATTSAGGTSGTIGVQASGSITMDAGATDRTNGANLILYALSGNITLGVLDARTNGDRAGGTLTNQAAWGLILVDTTVTGTTTGSILDAKTDATATTPNLYAAAARLSAGTAIGRLGAGVDNAIETEVIALAAQTTANGGGIDLRDLTDVTIDTVGPIGISTLSAAGVASAYNDTNALSDLTSTANGSIVLRTVNGAITLNDGANANGTAVSANGSGNVRIEAGGATSDVTVNAQILSGSGNITAIAGRSVSQQANLIVAANPGTIEVVATAGTITMGATVVAQTGGANIRYAAGLDITLGVLDARTNADRTGGTLAQQSDATTPWGSVSVVA
ncbi:MAG TPA: hypothetical protein VIH37_05150, partial [Candidatus Limnocylindrales bacterium]